MIPLLIKKKKRKKAKWLEVEEFIYTLHTFFPFIHSPILRSVYSLSPPLFLSLTSMFRKRKKRKQEKEKKKESGTRTESELKEA